jgi:hypothetical protein
MSYKVPQYSDIIIRFDNIHYNVAPTGIDLDNIDDFVCSIGKGRPNASGDNLVRLTYSDPLESGRFTIDSTENRVDVQFLSSEVGSVTGCYYTNLWLIHNDRYLTHVIKEFEVVPSVYYA